MHSEWVELSEENAEKIGFATKEGKRIIAIGTTTVRTLEGIFRMQNADNRMHVSTIRPYKGDINLFIMPGFKFCVVDAMITNFHLPKSTLLMLVSSFAGYTQFMLECYQKAVKEKYRFYSFGDAMLIV